MAALWLANTWVAILYPDEPQEEIFANGDTRISGAFALTGTPTPVDGRYLLGGLGRARGASCSRRWLAVHGRVEVGLGPATPFI